MAKIAIKVDAAVRVMCGNIVTVDENASSAEIIAACRQAFLNDLREGLLDDLIAWDFEYEPEDIEILSHHEIGREDEE